MTSSEIRQSFLDFFRAKQHTIVPSSSLMPDAPNLRMQIVRCADCGLHYQNPRPKLSALGRFYPNDYSPYRGEEKDKPIDDSVRGLVLRDAFGAPALRPSNFGHFVARTVTRKACRIGSLPLTSS